MEPQRYCPLTIRVDHDGGTAVVHLSGAATIDQADHLTAELRRIAAEPVQRIVLDLAELEFICSMGLGSLIVAHVITQRRKAQVVLAAPQPAIREILETTRLDRIFPVFTDVGSAAH